MTNYLRGSKRLKIIQNYLNGIEDENYEVFPTKTENKYIVRKRKEAVNIEPSKEEAASTRNLQQAEEPINEEQQKEDVMPIEEAASTLNLRQPKEPIKPTQPPPRYIRKPTSTTSQEPMVTPSAYDPTMNFEILNQLKLLGEEIKKERERKEQKKMMKDVFNKQMKKQKFYAQQQPQYIQEPNIIENEEEEESKQILQPQPIYRRRNNIFSDIY